MLWTGADDGPIHVSRDGWANWSRVDQNLPAGSPTLGVVAEIEPSRTTSPDAELVDDVELTVRDPSGTVVRRLAGPGTAGLHQVTWDLEPDGARPTESRVTA